MKRYITLKDYLLDEEVPNGMGIKEGRYFSAADGGGGLFLHEYASETPAPYIFLSKQKFNKLIEDGYFKAVQEVQESETSNSYYKTEECSNSVPCDMEKIQSVFGRSQQTEEEESAWDQYVAERDVENAQEWFSGDTLDLIPAEEWKLEEYKARNYEPVSIDNTESCIWEADFENK